MMTLHRSSSIGGTMYDTMHFIVPTVCCGWKRHAATRNATTVQTDRDTSRHDSRRV
jgi:hypothetical protein